MEIVRIHIGKRAPKGYVELPGAIHLGRGIWMMKLAKIVDHHSPELREALRKEGEWLMDRVVYFDCHFDGDWAKCDKDCGQLKLCKRRT